MAEYVIIMTMEKLKELASHEDGLECSIILKGGMISRKKINFDGEIFYIFNYIDESEQELTEIELMDKSKTNIGEALKNSSLVYWPGEN